MSQRLSINHHDLHIDCDIHPSKSRHPENDPIALIVPGLCHTAEHFEGLTHELNEEGISCANLTYTPKGNGWIANNFMGFEEYVGGTHEILEEFQAETRRDISMVISHSMGARIVRTVMSRDEMMRRPRVELAPVLTEGIWKRIAWEGMKRPDILQHSIVDVRKGICDLKLLNVQSAMSDPDHMQHLFFSRNADKTLVKEAADQTVAVPFWTYWQLLWEKEDIKKVREILQPTQVITATRDRLFPLRSYNDYKAMMLVDDYTFTKIKGTHDFFIEKPKETADKILSWSRQKKII